MKITCALNSLQIEKLFKLTVSAMKDAMNAGVEFNSDLFMQDLFDKISERQDPANAAKFIQQIPSLMYLASGRNEFLNLKNFDANKVRSQMIEFKNPDIGLISVIDTFGKGTTPEDLITLNTIINTQALQLELTDESEADPIVKEIKLKPFTAFTSTFQEFVALNPETKELLSKDEVDASRVYIYNTLNNIKNAILNDTTLSDDIVYQDKTLKLKATKLLSIDQNDLDDTTVNDIRRSLGISKDNKEIVYQGNVVTQIKDKNVLVISDSEGSFLYFDKNGNLSTKEQGGKLVFQYIRDVRNSKTEKGRLVVTDIYGKVEQILDPLSIARAEAKALGLSEQGYATQLSLNGSSLKERIQEIDTEQQQDFKTLKDFNARISTGEEIVVPLAGFSVGVSSDFPMNKVTLNNLSKLDGINRNTFKSIKIVKDSRDGFIKGNATIILNTNEFKVDRPVMTEDIANKIAAILVNSNIKDSQKVLFLDYFMSNNISNSSIKYKFYYDKTTKALTFYLRPFTYQEANGKKNNLEKIDLTPNNKQVIIDGLLNAYGTPGNYITSRMTYNEKALKTEKYFDYDLKTDTLNTTPSDYIALLQSFPAEVYLNAASDPGFYNSYMQFSVDSEVVKEKAQIQQEADSRSDIRKKKDLIAEVLKDGDIEAIVTNVDSGVKEGKQYAFFNVKVDNISYRIKLDKLRETADFTFPSIGSQVTLTVDDVTTKDGIYKDVVSVNNSNGQKLGNMYETDFENNELPRQPISPETVEKINNIVKAKEDVSIEPDNGTVSSIFALERTSSLPNGVTKSQIRKANLWWSNSPLSKFIDIKHMANIVNSDAYARFIASAEILDNGGKLGKIEINEASGGNMVDVYHEAWHVFSQLFLTKGEKISLYNEVRNSNPKYTNLSNFAIEEKIAEDFRDYALNQKTKKGAPKRNTIFRKILNFLKGLFNKKVSTNNTDESPTVTELFNNLYLASENPKLLNNYTPLIDNVMFDILNRGIQDIANKKEDVLNFQDSQLISNSIDSIISEILDEEQSKFKLKSGVLTILSDKLTKSGLTNKQVAYNQVKLRLEAKLKELNDQIDSFTEPTTDEEIYEQELVKDNKRIVNAALENWGDAKSGTVKYHMNNSTFDIVKQNYTLLEEEEEEDASSIDSIENNERSSFDNKIGTFSLETLASKETLYILKSLFKLDNKNNVIKNRLGFNELADFSSVWNNVTRAIGGVNDRDEAYQKLSQAALTFPELKQLVNSKLPSPKELTNLYENRISTGFWQDFRKPRIPYIQLTAFKNNKSDYNLEVTEASIETSNVISKFKNKFNAASANKFITKNENNNSVLNLQAIVDAGFNTSKSFEFVRSLGIELDNLDIIKKSLENDPNYYGLSYLYDYVKKVNQIAKDPNASSDAKKLLRRFKSDPIGTFMSKVKPGILGEDEVTEKSLILKLAELQGRYGVDSSNFSVLNAERNLVYEHIDHHTISIITDAINNVTDIRQLWNSDRYNYTSYLDPSKNTFTLRSKILNSLFNIQTMSYDRISDNKLDLQIVSGTQVADSDLGSNTTSLDISSKFLQEMHMMLKSGLQEFMRHASKASSYGARVNGEIVGGIDKGDDAYLYVDLDKFGESGVAESYANEEIFLDYISVELARIIKFKQNIDVSKTYAGYNRKIKDKEGNVIGMAGEFFTAFDNAISEATKNKLYDLEDKVDIGDVNFLKNYLATDPILKDEIFNDLNSYFESQTNKNLKSLNQNNFIDPALLNRLNVFNLNRSEAEKALVKAFTYNSWIHNFETASLFYGDIVQYNHAKEEMHKRNTGSTSGGLGFLTDIYSQNFVNNILNKNSYASTLPIAYQKFNYNGTFNTAIMQDVVRPSVYISQIEKGLREDYAKRYENKSIPQSEIDRRIKLELKPYQKIEEADGQGYITFDAYRTLKTLQNAWSDQQEIMFRKIANGAKVDASEVIELFPVYKVQHFGHLANTELPVNAMHKFALAPLIPSVIKGSDLQSLHEQMMTGDIQYVTFQTGSKVGSVTSEIDKDGDAVADVIYNDGNQKQLKSDIKFTPNTIYLEYLKDVTKVPNTYKGKTIFSTQLRKLITEGMYENGKIVNSDNAPFIKAYEKAVNEYTAILKTELLNEIGFELKNDKYTGNLDKLLSVVQKELTRREMPEHLVRYIGVTKNGEIKNDLSFHLEADDIEKILVSLIQKRLVKQKVKGEALVQISSALTNGLWTNGLKNATDADVQKYLGSNTLPFYNRVDGVTSAMKVAIALQGDFKNLLNLKDNDGVTIETIERLNELVKDDTWVENNRSSITMTAVRIPVQGLNSMEFMEVYHFLDPAAGNIIIPPTEIVAKSGTDFDVDKLTVFMPNLNAEGSAVTSDKTNDEINALINSNKLKDKEVKKLIKTQKLSLENKLISTVKDILSLPDNYAGLVRPNDTYLLKEIADKLQDQVIDYNRFDNEFKEGPRYDNKKVVISPTRVLEIGYNLHKHDVNMVGKQGLGIVALKNALHPVFTSLGAKMPLKYKEQIKTGYGSEVAEGPIEYDMRLLLNHNKTPEGNISLSGLYSADGMDKISDLYSQMMNGLVDVEKDAWIFFIQGNLETIPILTYLLKAGVPKEEAILFVSQPLMREYAKQKKLLNSTYGTLSGISPEQRFFVNYQAAQTVLNNKIPSDILSTAALYKTVDQLKNSKDTTVKLIVKNKEPKNVSKKKLIEILDADNIKDIVDIVDSEGVSLFRSANTKGNNVNSIKGHPVSNANFYYTALAASDNASAKVFTKEKLEENLNNSDSISKDAIAAFLHFLEIEKQIKGIETVQRQSNPDTKVSKTIQEISQKAVNLEEAAEMSKVDPGLVKKLKDESILASFFDNQLTVDILEPLFKLRNNNTVANYIEMVIASRQNSIRKAFPGKEPIKDFINTYKNAVVNYAYQNYLTNFIDSDGNVTDMPDVYRKLPITKTTGLVKGVEVTDEGIKVDMARLEKDYNLKLYENTSLAEDRYSSPERNLRGFAPDSNFFPTKSSFFRFNVEREFLRNKFPKDTLLENKEFLHLKSIISRSIKDDTKASNAAYEAYLNQRALLNTYNRNAIMNNSDYSFSQKVMDIINEFPHLKTLYPVLSQISIPNVKSGEKVLTLNNKGMVKGELAESYYQNLADLGNVNVIKASGENNQRISDVFSLFPQVMIYQHGIGNSKYGFNKVLPYQTYLSIMRNASALFINKNLNIKTFEDIYSKMMKMDDTKRLMFKDYITPVNPEEIVFQYGNDEESTLVEPIVSDSGTTMSFGTKATQTSINLIPKNKYTIKSYTNEPKKGTFHTIKRTGEGFIEYKIIDVSEKGILVKNEETQKEKLFTEDEYFKTFNTSRDAGFSILGEFGLAEVYKYTELKNAQPVYSLEINLYDESNEGKGLGKDIYKAAIQEINKRGGVLTPGNVVKGNKIWESFERDGLLRNEVTREGDIITVIGSYTTQPTVESVKKVKKGVSELFESNPELSNIGTPEQYSQWINYLTTQGELAGTQATDILYHGTYEEFEEFDEDKKGANTGINTYQSEDKSEQFLSDSANTIFFSDRKTNAISYTLLGRDRYLSEILDALQDVRSGLQDLVTDAVEVLKGVPYFNNLIEKAKQEGKTSKEIIELLGKEETKLAKKYKPGSSSLFTNELAGYENSLKELNKFLSNIDILKKTNDINFTNSTSNFKIFTKDGKVQFARFDKGRTIKTGERFYADQVSDDKIKEFIKDAIAEDKNSYTQAKIKMKAAGFEEKAMPVLLNLQNPSIHDYERSAFPDVYKNTKTRTAAFAAKQVADALKNGNDGVIYKNIVDPLLSNSYGIFDVKNIYILGGKQDIEGFKNFLSQSNVESITNISDFYNSLTEEQKKKIGTLEDLNEQYNEIPFQMTEEEFINNIKCNL